MAAKAPSDDGGNSLTDSMETIPLNAQYTTTDLKASSDIWYKLHVLIYDLRHYSTSDVSLKRLESIVDASYIGSPYFSPSEALMIKSTCLIDLSCTIEKHIEGILKERLERRIKKRVESGDFRVCAAHDVAPILEKIVGVKPKDLERDPGFMELMENDGLNMPEGSTWNGISKGMAVGGKSKGKKGRKK